MLDPVALSDLLTKGGVVAGLAFFAWLFLTDRLFTKARVQEYADRAEKAETQRDDAFDIARASTQAVKDLTATNQAVLDFVKSTLASRSGQ